MNVTFCRRKTVLLVAFALFCTSAAAQTGAPQNAIVSSNHYKDTGMGHATGRAGNATINARALYGKDGSTLVELTTGQLDSSVTTPGNLDKVQFKPLDQNGNALYSQNFNGLTAGGYFGMTINVLHHTEQLQLQTNVSGIDTRTDVVTVVETVKLRPDLVVQGLTNPNKAVVNQPVIISATLRELNGEVGATTTCTLYVNGIAVDHAYTVWVDAAGTVSCSFTQTFAATGIYSLQVSAENVLPPDWDTANNSVTGSIEIDPPTIQMNYYASFNDILYNTHSIFQNTTYYNGAIYDDYSSADGYSYEYQSADINFWTTSSFLQFPATLSYQETMDSNVVFHNLDTMPGFTVFNSDGSSYSAGSRNIANLWINAYSFKGIPITSSYIYTAGYLNRYAGDVTYFSNRYQCAWWSTPNNCQNGNYYSWNSSSDSPYGTLVAPGNQWGATLNITGNDGLVFSVSPVVPLSTYTRSYGYPNWTGGTTPQCYSVGDPFYSVYAYKTCFGYDNSNRNTSGTATSP